ncbi:phenylacetate--CoA ligase family protein [Kribbella sp. VKM Ac-2568]|uniref:phenylacetate--CoA ligase family protein n=1 Tax=Kribbella sp. VKM Ac-2568 TaxID=2512219 RepID=UPI0010431E98|nr:phenylacetate--CoA ligase family protein [Kribbella sp. VKM Ac-2568]TCM49014.1 putative adenylate-forming enzyme [Kribbella sp. VKM Ac-2568]
MSTLRQLADVAVAFPRSRELLSRDGWSREQLQEHQRTRLAELIRHAKEQSPFYRKLYAGLDDEVSLDQLPVIDKATLMDHFDDIVTDQRLRLTDLEAHLAGLATDDLYLGQYRVVATAGSTGRRGIFVADPDEWRTFLAGLLRSNEYMGLRPHLPRRRVATVAAASSVHVTYRMSRSLDFGVHRVLRLDATAPIEVLVQRLNAFQPEFLYSYPSVLGLLATERAAGRLRIDPTTIVSSGETHTDETVRAVRAVWDVPWYQIYGTTEVPMLGAHCSQHTGVHLFEDLAIVEVVDGNNRPVPAGQRGHRLLVTNLVNRTLPLIRYVVTDLATAAEEPCPCGRPFAVLSALDGRSDDILHLPTAGGGKVAVHPLALRSAMATVADLAQYRILHEGTKLTVSATLRADAAPEPAVAAITERLGAKLAALGVEGMQLDVRLVPRIEEGRDAAGKFRIIESRP